MLKIRLTGVTDDNFLYEAATAAFGQPKYSKKRSSRLLVGSWPGLLSCDFNPKGSSTYSWIATAPDKELWLALNMPAEAQIIRRSPC